MGSLLAAKWRRASICPIYAAPAVRLCPPCRPPNPPPARIPPISPLFASSSSLFFHSGLSPSFFFSCSHTQPQRQAAPPSAPRRPRRRARGAMAMLRAVVVLAMALAVRRAGSCPRPGMPLRPPPPFSRIICARALVSCVVPCGGRAPRTGPAAAMAGGGPWLAVAAAAHIPPPAPRRAVLHHPTLFCSLVVLLFFS